MQVQENNAEIASAGISNTFPFSNATVVLYLNRVRLDYGLFDPLISNLLTISAHSRVQEVLRELHKSSLFRLMVKVQPVRHPWANR